MGNYDKGNGRGIQWLRKNVEHDGDDCLVWPMFRNEEGYGVLGYEGKIWKANRLMCVLAHGDPPTPKHVAAHSCNNGHLGCVNPRHLSWKTHSENVEDKRRAGARMNSGTGARTHLTSEQVAEIRSLKGKVNGHDLAKRYGLSRPGVRYWQNTTHDPVPPSKRRRVQSI